MRSVPGRTACRDRAESFPHSGSKCRSHSPRQRQREGEADTPDPRLSMVTRAVDNGKQQIIPEPALSHYFHCLPLHRFFGAADRLPRGCTSLLSPFWGSTCQSCFRTQPRPGRWRGRGPPSSPPRSAWRLRALSTRWTFSPSSSEAKGEKAQGPTGEMSPSPALLGPAQAPGHS